MHRRIGGLVWLPAALATAFYALPVVRSLDRPLLVALVLVPGLLSLGVLTRRHTAPRLVSAVAVGCLLVSPAALGGVIGIIASRARRLRDRRHLVEIVGWTLAAVVAKVIQLVLPYPGGEWTSASSVDLTMTVSAIGFALFTGLLSRARTDSVDAAQRAEQSRAAEIRLEERARIAREMHDVVAHRISLVAMVSGALVHRDDLPDDAQEAATIIRTNSRLALDELRAVLRDLRDDGGSPTGTTAAPQPDLAQLPVLLAEVREVTDVNYTCEIDTAALPPTASRQLYRILQEGLTNARKHAPAQPVSVRITRSGGDVVLEVRNPFTGEVGESGGYGLVGIQERARLLGGHARVDVIDSRFVLTATIPAKVGS